MRRICAAPGCSNALERRANERPGQFEQRKYCCQNCAAKQCRGRPSKTAMGSVMIVDAERSPWDTALFPYADDPGDGGFIKTVRPETHVHYEYTY